jgi:hypothetical protein
VDGLAARLRSAAEALGDAAGIEASWLRGAADLVEQGEAERHSARADAVWLEELAPEARARKAALLSAWVDAAEALRAAIHALESERGPLVESLFPAWRGASLRRHADQALAAELELQRRLSSGYVARRLAELATHAALGTALEALAGAGATWAAERDRPALAGAEADVLRARLLALAGRTAQLLERVRWVVRAALADRPEVIDEVFPRRTRRADAAEPSAARTLDEAPASAAAPANTVSATQTAPAPAPRAEGVAPPKRRSRAVRRTPEADAGASVPASAAAASDEAVSARAPGHEEATSPRRQASPRRASRPARAGSAPVTPSTTPSPAGNSGRGAAPSTRSAARTTRAPAPAAAPSTRSPARATRAPAPGSTSPTGPERDTAVGTASAPAPGKARPPSGRGAGRKARPAHRK